MTCTVNFFSGALKPAGFIRRTALQTFSIAHGSRHGYAAAVSTAALERQVVDQLRELYWRPYLYHKLGRDLLKLRKAEDKALDRPKSGNKTRSHWLHGDKRLRDLAEAAGVPLGNEARAPSLCYLAIQLARDIPFGDLVWYRKHGLEWDQVRRMLRLLGPCHSPAERDIARSKIRTHVEEHGAKDFNGFIKASTPIRRTNHLTARKDSSSKKTA